MKPNELLSTKLNLYFQLYGGTFHGWDNHYIILLCSLPSTSHILQVLYLPIPYTTGSLSPHPIYYRFSISPSHILQVLYLPIPYTTGSLPPPFHQLKVIYFFPLFHLLQVLYLPHPINFRFFTSSHFPIYYRFSTSPHQPIHYRFSTSPIPYTTGSLPPPPSHQL